MDNGGPLVFGFAALRCGQSKREVSLETLSTGVIPSFFYGRENQLEVDRRSLIHLVQASFNRTEPRVHGPKPIADFLRQVIQAMLDAFQAVLDAFQAVLDAFQAMLDSVEAMLDSIEAMLDSIEAMLDSVEA